MLCANVLLFIAIIQIFFAKIYQSNKMETNKIHYGLIIKQLCEEKNLKVSNIFAQLGFAHRNGVYQSFNRENFDLSELDLWGEVLGMTRNEIIQRAEGEHQTVVIEDNLLQTMYKDAQDRIKELQYTIKLQSSLLGHSVNFSLVSKDIASCGFRLFFYSVYPQIY